MLDWNDLRYLLAIARAGTLAGAARSLGVEHTTVGRRLTALETGLSARLFLRGPEGFVPTAACQAILPLAQQVADQVDAIERRVAGDDEKVEGTVRLTTSEALSGYLVRQFGGLYQKHPRLVVDIQTGNRAYDLMRGEADIAIRVRETSEPDLLVRKLVTAGWSLYAAPSYVARKGLPASPEALAGHDLIDFDQSLSASPGALWTREHGGGANVVLRGNSIVAALNACMLGLGVAAVPCFLGDLEPTLQRLTPRLVGERGVFLVAHPDVARTARVRAVMDYVVDIFTRDAALWSGCGATSV